MEAGLRLVLMGNVQINQVNLATWHFIFSFHILFSYLGDNWTEMLELNTDYIVSSGRQLT